MTLGGVGVQELLLAVRTKACQLDGISRGPHPQVESEV